MPISNDLQIVQVPIDELIDRDTNPNEHPEEQIEDIRASIRRFGFVDPLLVDENNIIIAGHGTRLAARLEGLQTIPVIYAQGFDEAELEALQVALNKIPKGSYFNPEKLKASIKIAVEGGLKVEDTGFSQPEIDQLLAGWSNGGADDTPGNDGVKQNAIIRIEVPRALEDEVIEAIGEAIQPFEQAQLL